MATAARPAIRVRLVGDLRVESGVAVRRGPDLGSRKARLLLAVLAADAAHRHPVSDLADVLWPQGPPPAAAATVASLVSRLRHTVDPTLIEGNRAGYRIGGSADVAVDLDEAEALVGESERRLAAGQPGLAAAGAAAALDLLTGTVLAGLPDAAWVDRARSEHGQALRRARLASARAHLAVGDHATAVAVCRLALADDVMDEDVARTLMTALAAGGEPAAALRVFDGLRRGLADELGTDPAPATTVVYEQILRAEAPPPVPVPRPASTAPLVGREAEFAVLRDAWQDATSGAGSMVLLTGQAGAGKTRLAQALEHLAVDTGGTVLSARCYEAERALFLQPLVEAIGASVSQRSPDEVRVAASHHLYALARLVPEIGALVGEVPSERAAAGVERRRAFEAVASLLRGLARDRPVLVLLDDLHNAGASTTEALHFLRTVLPTTRLLVVATIRSEEGADTLQMLAPVANQVPVGALPRSAVQQLAMAAGQAHRADEINRRTGGHALFVVEVLRDATPDGHVPATLQAAVLARVARAGAAVERVLRAGAVLGAAFEPHHAAALAGTSPSAGLTACERALQAGLVRVAGRAYEFVNDLVREVLYETTPAPTRQAHHAQSMDLLTDAPEQVAAHAVAIGDWPRAARSWLRAAENALRVFAAADAAALATRALAAADSAGDLELRGRALVARGRARDAQARFAEAWEDFTAAGDAARTAGDQRLEMAVLRELAGDVPVALGRPPAANEPTLQRCLKLAESLGDRVVEADVLDRLAVLAAARLDFVQALHHGERALRAARASRQEAALIFALDAVKTAYAYLGEIEPLVAVIEELEPMLRRTGNLWMLQWTVFESAFAPLARGDHGAALARIEAALAVNRRSGYAPMEPFYVAHLAWTHRLAGDLDTALRIGAGAVAAAREHAHSWWLSTAASLHAATLLHAGLVAEARTLLTGIRPSLEVDGAQAYLARCLGPLAEATGSLDVLEDADALLRAVSAPAGSAWLGGADSYLSVARAWQARDAPDRAAAVLVPFLDAARRAGWVDLVRLGDAVLAR